MLDFVDICRKYRFCYMVGCINRWRRKWTDDVCDSDNLYVDELLRFLQMAQRKVKYYRQFEQKKDCENNPFSIF